MVNLYFLLGLLLISACAGPVPHDHPRMSDFVIIQAHDGSFVRVAENKKLIADLSTQKNATHFLLVNKSSSTISLQAPSFLYVATDYHNQNHLIARSKTVQAWEEILVLDTLGIKFLLSSNGTYIYTDDQHFLKSGSANQTAACSFKIIPLDT